MQANEVASYVARRLHKWKDNNPATKRDLAYLRHAIGKTPESQPTIWGVLFESLPEDLISFNGSLSYAENAIFVALTGYALHQQSHDIQSQNMNQTGWSLGQAVRKLAANDDELERVRKRFNVLATSSNMKELSHYLYQMIRMLRAKNIPLDYPRLAKDLYFFQFPDTKKKVMLRWGEDFYRAKKSTDAINNEENKGE